MSYSQILPAPGSLINRAGMLDNVNGEPSPGFSGLNLKSTMSVEVHRSRSNRGLPVSKSDNIWSFSISYHPMTRNTLDSLESFILGMNTRVNPFYVILPNYSKSKNELFNTFNSTNALTVTNSAFAGDNSFIVEAPIDIPSNSIPLPGDYFNIVDSSDALHKGVYKVTRVETSIAHAGIAPPAGKIRLSIFPPLQRDKVGLFTLVFQNPKFRVLQKGDYEIDIDENNLFSLSINVEEILP